MSVPSSYGGGGKKPPPPSTVFGGGMGSGGAGGGGGAGDKGLTMSVFLTLKLAWADTDLRQRILFVLGIFAVYALGIHIQVPVPGITPEELTKRLSENQFFQMINIYGGGALKRLSIFALGLNPYITASIILQILTQAYPAWKQELKEGGEYARQKQNRRTRMLSLILCVAQGWGFITMLKGAAGPNVFTPMIIFSTLLFWTAGAMFVLWMGEQISQRGIGNGVSLMIFAGIIISLPGTVGYLADGVRDGVIAGWKIGALIAIFLTTTWLITYFTVAQRRIPIQHMRRTQGTKIEGGQTSYLPFSVNMAGVIPIIFAISLIYMPVQFAGMVGQDSPVGSFLLKVNDYINPGSQTARGFQILLGSIAFTLLIGFFTYFYTAIQYNVDDIADNLKRGGSFIPGVRPGKQTSDFLNNVISRITVVGALFLALVSLVQFLTPRMLGMQGRLNVIGGSTLLIMVSVALETMRQIEANLTMKRYNA